MIQDAVSPADLKTYLIDLFQACGIDKPQSVSIAQNLVWSELVGRHNYGVIRIPVHLKRLELGLINPACAPDFTLAAPGTGLLDADNGFGYFAGEMAMDKAIGLARENGIGMVGVKNSNFFGAGAYFVNMAADKGMIAFAMSNSFPKVVAHGGMSAVLGTNPFAFGAPRQNGDHLLVDFATSSIAGSAVREILSKGEKLPDGQAVLPDGQPETDPGKIGEAALIPFGGAKGYGVALVVEILSGVLTGSGFSHSVKSIYTNFTEKGDNGHCMIAIDIGKYMPVTDYFARIDALITLLKASNEIDEVLFPGETRWKNFRHHSEHGLTIPEKVKCELNELAGKYGVTPPWRVSV